MINTTNVWNSAEVELGLTGGSLWQPHCPRTNPGGVGIDPRLGVAAPWAPGASKKDSCPQAIFKFHPRNSFDYRLRYEPQQGKFVKIGNFSSFQVSIFWTNSVPKGKSVANLEAKFLARKVVKPTNRKPLYPVAKKKNNRNGTAQKSRSPNISAEKKSVVISAPEKAKDNFDGNR